MIYLSIPFLIAAGLAEGWMDWLQFRLPLNPDHRLSAHPFWDPSVSWKSKWKDGDYIKGERFPLSSTMLVFLTDGWHLMKWIRNRCLDVSIGLVLACSINWWQVLLALVVFRLLYWFGFWLRWRKKN